MPTVTYNKTVSDSNVKSVMQRIADKLGRNISVHSGDRTFVPKGSSTASLHIQKRAADFHIHGLTDKQGFTNIKSVFNDLFDASEAYEFIHHGPYTATGGEHLHIGRYGNGRAGYVKFKTKGLSPGTKGNYSDIGSETKRFTGPNNAPVSSTLVSGITVDATVLSPSIGVFKSVGIGGSNIYNDVFLIQTLMNKALPRLKKAGRQFEHFNPLREDGDCGQFTKNAITIFQRDVLGMAEPDGRIDPGGKTIRSLYVAAYGSVETIVPVVGRVATLANGNSNGTVSWNGVLAWGSHPKVGSSFRDKAVQVCRDLRIKNPSWLMTVMAFETDRSFSPAKKNYAGSSGTGLIQFMKKTIDGRNEGGKFYPGIGQKLGITHADLADMSAVRQLDVVKAYFEQFGSKTSSAADVHDLYFLVLLPSAFGKADDATMFRSGTVSYRDNKGLDTNDDGKITVEETARKIRAMLREGLDKHPYHYERR